jgi:hypothetical protein
MTHIVGLGLIPRVKYMNLGFPHKMDLAAFLLIAVFVVSSLKMEEREWPI